MDVVATFEAPVEIVRSADADQLLTSFIDLCFNGKALLPAESTTQVAYSDLPPVLRRWYSKPTSSRIYRLKASKPSYLLSMTNRPSSNNYIRQCALASQALSMDHAWAKVTKQGDLPPEIRKTHADASVLLLPRPDEGYEFSLKKIGYGYIVAQVSILNERQKKAAQETQAELARRTLELQNRR